MPLQDIMVSAQSLEVARVLSTQDLQEQLGIDVASYGCATFGAGISGRFDFVKKARCKRRRCL